MSTQTSARLGSFVAATGVLVALGAQLLSGPHAALSAAVGAALALGNFHAWRWLVGRMLARRVQSGPPLTLLLVVKAALGLGGVALLLAVGAVAPVPFLFGLGSLFLGLVAGSAWLAIAEPAVEGEG